jgi:hypothetical protein
MEGTEFQHWRLFSRFGRRPARERDRRDAAAAQGPLLPEYTRFSITILIIASFPQKSSAEREIIWRIFNGLFGSLTVFCGSFLFLPLDFTHSGPVLAMLFVVFFGILQNSEPICGDFF